MTDALPQSGGTSEPLAGPDRIRLSAVDPFGPLGRPTRGARFETARVALAASGPRPVEVAAVAGGPVHRDDGTATGVLLLADWRQGEPLRPLAPDDRLEIRLDVQGRLPSGLYHSEITIRDAEGGRLQALPVTLSVRAHWAWALVFLVLGLLVVGAVAYLDGEAEIRDEMARVLEQRRDLRELTDRFPEEQLDPLVVRGADESLMRAAQILVRPRGLSVRDDRAERAAELREEVAADYRELQASIDGKSPGKAAREHLAAAWKDLQERLIGTRVLAPSADDLPPVPSGFDRALLRFLTARWQVEVAATLESIEDHLVPRVEAVARAATADEDERARRLATATRRQIHRGARWLDQQVESFLFWRGYGGLMSMLHARLSHLTHEPGLPPPAEREIAARLEAASRQLAGDTSLIGFRDAHAELQRATVTATAAGETAMLARLESAIAEATARTSLDRIDNALSRLTPGAPAETKRRRISVILELWRQRLAGVADEARRLPMERLVERMEEPVAAGDWEAVVEGMQELTERWFEYQEQEVARARAAVLVPHCRAQAALLSQELAVERDLAALVSDDPEYPEIDQELERLREELAAMPDDVGCYDVLVAASGSVPALGDRLLAARFRRFGPVDDVQLAAAVSADATRAIREARRLMAPVRPLDIAVRTPEEEWVQGRRIVFELRGLNATWGAGTRISFDFGDGSTVWIGDAEQARQRSLFVHRYPRPERFRVRVAAVQEPLAGTAQPAGELVGEGTTVLDVAPDPVSRARRLAALFLNLRFALALAVALVIEGWRLYGDKPFGARRRDYFEAFAVGFAAHLGVDGLAAVLPSLIG